MKRLAARTLVAAAALALGACAIVPAGYYGDHGHGGYYAAPPVVVAPAPVVVRPSGYWGWGRRHGHPGNGYYRH